MSLVNTTVEERLSRHEDVLKSYKDKFEEHKRWLQGQRDLPSFVTKESGRAWDDSSAGSDESAGDDCGVSGRQGQPIHDTLLEMGKLYEQKKEAAREEAIRRELKHLRKTPRISRQGAAKVYEKPIEERFMELEAKRRKDLEDAERGRKDDGPQYTFTPTITRKGRQATVRTSSSTKELNDQWKDRRNQKLEEARSRQVVEALAEMQPGPTINEHSQRLIERRRRDDSGVGRGPHYNHADSLLERDRLSKLHLWEKYQQELAEQQPGNPKITPFAASLVRDGPVSDRLYEQSFDKEERKNYLLLRKMEAEGNECYHTPRITWNAAVLRRDVPVEDDLLDRHETAKSKKEERMKQILDRERHLHQPAINPVSDEIASRLCQTARERLYGPKADYSALQRPADDTASAGPLTPRNGSRRAHSQTTADFHVRGERGREISNKRLDLLRAQQERQLMADCTFQPKICRAPVDASNRADFLNRTSLRLKRKDDKLKQARKERDIREEQECPFRPNVGYRQNINIHEDQQPVVGHDGRALGYGEFVERHRIARKMQQKRDETSVTGRNWKNEVTVPREFQLGRKERRVKSLQKPLSPPQMGPGGDDDDDEDGGGGQLYDDDRGYPAFDHRHYDPPTQLNHTEPVSYPPADAGPYDAAAGPPPPASGLPQQGLFSAGSDALRKQRQDL
eukprot:gene3966-6144_t